MYCNGGLFHILPMPVSLAIKKKGNRMHSRTSALLVAVFLGFTTPVMADPAVDTALQSVKKAVEDLEKRCSSGGGSAKLITAISDNDLVALLKERGYASAAVAEAGTIGFKMEGMKILLLNGNGALQLYFSVSGTSADLARMNTWNTTKRYSRAYLDKDKDPTLESDLMLKDGVSKESIAQFVQVFSQSLSTFRREVAY